MRCRCTTMPVSATMSARAQRSKSIASTFSSMSVMRWGAGVSAASNGKAATGMLALLPSKGNACSRPQKEIWNLGLIRTMSAMTPPGAPLAIKSNGVRRQAPSSSKQRIKIVKFFMLVEGVAICHAGDEIADLAGKAALVVGKRVFTPIGRQEFRVVHIGFEQIANNPLGACHNGKDPLMAVHAMREKHLQDAVLLLHLGAEADEGHP